ncbi:2-oxoadipate dioxygenase/decarboxylase HglS [Variovorax fucosicus]|uniref:2-oxoadipate dioxygenase/decarboxylase HglS n=1 Tax=Variovorax fucosicus TaxID=3053517 RepID=UPI0025770364|nr:VOC family protein [Variovorax sp. J22G47]MDM0055331.1 VOC family protein [Variovorax sp. J22G47]
MQTNALVDPDDIRGLFSRALSGMYKAEVPQYGDLLDLVADINAQVLREREGLADRLREAGQLDRLDVERHGAIRLGTVGELAVMRRLFAVMGMRAVGYYNLSVAGVPVHATAFRPVDESSLQRNPFRVFTSLLRLDLIDDAALRERAAQILAGRNIFTPRCLELIGRAERDGGLSGPLAQEFVAQALETFRWHSEATVDIETYRQLRASHPLIADVVSFKGPHINHLTPRVLDIDRAQAAMLEKGIRAKDAIEGPPKRRFPILLRQTSFIALEEPIRFQGAEGVDGTHTARFGEIEQRGCALTPKGRALYDELLNAALAAGSDAVSKASALAQAFEAFPDDARALRRKQLAYFRYSVDRGHADQPGPVSANANIEALLDQGLVRAEPLVYEDFLPVSAAGIFRSNLGSEGAAHYAAGGNRAAFEAALGVRVMDEFALYEAAQAASLEQCRRELADLVATASS